MESEGIRRITKASLLAALTFAATMIVHIPLPGAGYVHPGDAVVLLGGAFVGPMYGFFAAGIGSALADLALGYAAYAPASFVIKGIAALAAALIYRRHEKTVIFVLGCLAGAAVVVLGYFAFEWVLYGFPAALAGVVPNILQTLFGVLIASILRTQVFSRKIGR